MKWKKERYEILFMDIFELILVDYFEKNSYISIIPTVNHYLVSCVCNVSHGCPARVQINPKLSSNIFTPLMSSREREESYNFVWLDAQKCITLLSHGHWGDHHQCRSHKILPSYDGKDLEKVRYLSLLPHQRLPQVRSERLRKLTRINSKISINKVSYLSFFQFIFIYHWKVEKADFQNFEFFFAQVFLSIAHL